MVIVKSTDPEIICFQHCDSSKKIFCLDYPETCPLCQVTLDENTQLLINPYFIPFPFVSFKANISCCILIRTTNGDFLHNYENASDLHIGIVDSEGNIYEYDKDGVRFGRRDNSWNQCIAIQVTKEKSQMWKDYWDHTLAVLSTTDQWTPESYDEQENNCYSFVITFLKMLQVKQLEPSLTSKMQFCTDFIVPRTKNVAKYIALYRKVIREGVSTIPIHT